MIKRIILKHINENKFIYIKVCSIFLIGICLGVICVNSLNDKNFESSKDYFNNFKENIVHIKETDIKTLFINSIFSKTRIISIIFLFSCTIIGGILIYFLNLYKGFALGYVISALLKTYGVRKGILFAVSTLLIQNILYIPALIFFSVYGIISCKKIKNRNVDIKTQIVKLIVIFIIILIISTLSSTVELTFCYKIFKKIQFFY